jgi:hypothetical protein
MGKEFIQITSQNCHNCGASIHVSSNTDNLKCEYCDTQIRILRPVKMNEESMIGKLNDEEMNKYRNMLTILENSMKAGNFKEGYDYCNKVLEIDPTSSEIWENKAVCAFWLSTEKEVSLKMANEVTLYLNKAKSCEPISSSIEKTSKDIAYNIFNFCNKWLLTEKPNLVEGYSLEQINKMFDFLKLHKIAYDLHPNINFLKKAINELWVPTATNKQFLSGVMRWRLMDQRQIIIDEYETIIKSKDASYEAPKQKGKCFIATATLGSYEHPEVMELRNFRDNWILEKKWGEGFVAWYYHYGSIAAKSIEKSFVLKKICYLLIVKPLVYLSRIIN